MRRLLAVALLLAGAVGAQVTLAPFQGTRSTSALGGAIGLWYADRAQSSPRRYIPNSAVVDPAPTNLLTAGRRAFSNTGLWSVSAATATDYAVTGPDGLLEASTIVASTAAWYVNRSVPLLAGTYTIGINVKSNTGANQTFKIQDGSASGILTATTSWQRFTYTFTTAGGTNQPTLINDGTTAASLQICDFNLFSGSSDLGPEGDNSALSLGNGANDVTGTASGGILDLSASSSFGFVQLGSAYTLNSGVTVVALAQKTTTSSGYVAVLASPKSQYAQFSAALEYANVANFAYNGAGGGGIWPAISTVQQWPSEWLLSGMGWHTFAWRYDPSSTNNTVFLDGGQILKKTGAATARTVQDFWVGTINPGYGQGWKYAAIALFNRPLSDAEVRAAERTLLNRSTFSRGTLRYLAQEGDSITAGSGTYAYMFYANQSPVSLGAMYAVAGSKLADLNTRAANLDATIPPVAYRPPGAKYILSILIGTNDLAIYAGATDSIAANNYATDIAAFCDARRAAGWKVALGTLLPRNGVPNFNARRNIYNPIITGWVGTHVDAIFDFAADATMGPDAAAANTTYYSDGTHPTTAGQTILETIYRPVINGL